MVRVPSGLKIEDSTQSPGRIFNRQSSIQKVRVPWRTFLNPQSTLSTGVLLFFLSIPIPILRVSVFKTTNVKNGH